MFSPTAPYNELPLLPPRIDLETRAVLKACIDARAALAALHQATRLIPNPAVLINSIPLLEARGSSEIENIVTTTDSLFRQTSLDEETADAATKEALRYRTALAEGFRSLAERPVTTSTAVRVCSLIKNADMDIRRVPGTGLGNAVTGERVYTPPEGADHLRALLRNWEMFLHEHTDLDPLVRMAAGHYQFEAIHPFTDGNGRTGRVLNLLLLIEWGLLDSPVLYLSRAILAQKAEYYRLLLDVTTNEAWEPWLLFMIEAVRDTATWTTAKIVAIRALERMAHDYIRDRAPKVYSHALVQQIFEQPYCRIANLVESGVAKRQTASEYLKALVDLGVLSETKVGRDKLFLHTAFLSLLGSEDNDVPTYRETR